MNIARYEIIEELGRGGMATVYRARGPRFDLPEVPILTPEPTPLKPPPTETEAPPPPPAAPTATFTPVPPPPVPTDTSFPDGTLEF